MFTFCSDYVGMFAKGTYVSCLFYFKIVLSMGYQSVARGPMRAIGGISGSPWWAKAVVLK